MPTNQEIELTGASGAQHVFSTVARERDEASPIELRPTYISLGLPTTAFKPEFGGTADACMFDAAVGGGTITPGVVWFFNGDSYRTYTLPYDGRPDELSEPKNIHANWAKGEWPRPYANGVDAAVTFTSQPQYVWFFLNNTYMRYDLQSDVMAGGPHTIIPNWPGWPAEFASGIDAAIEGRGEFEGMAWFFKGSQYIRYNDATVKGVDIGPTPIASVWRGWPASFDRVDCAFYGVGGESKIIHFVRGDEFIMYNLKENTVVGSPAPLGTKFPKLAALSRRPQLFLREQIQLRTYYGSISAGDVIETKPMQAGAEETYSVIVKRTETQSVMESRTVLESQDESLVEDVNKSMRDEANEAHSDDAYSYDFNSSFEGEMDYTGFGGEVDASLSFGGHSNDVRKSASKASMNAIQDQVRRTDEKRRQSTEVVSGASSSTTQLENASTRKVANHTDKEINIGVFQLKQNYVALSVLTDIQVAFSSKNNPVFCKIADLDSMLGKYVADAARAEAIKKAIIAELQQVRNAAGDPVNVLKDLGNGRFGFDGNMKSTFEISNVDGSPQRQIEVDGLILGHNKFNILIPGVLLKELTIG